MTPDTIKAILNTRPDEQAWKMANELWTRDERKPSSYTFARFIQHASNVAKDIQRYGYRDPPTSVDLRERLQSLILPKPKITAAEVWERAGLGPEEFFAFAKSLARHGGKIVFEEEG